ncbi:MAG: hypothetical protein ACOCVM_09745 [Desulfovibrionaceae bacterium]
MNRCVSRRFLAAALLAAGLCLLDSTPAQARRVEIHQPVTEQAHRPSALKPLGFSKAFATAVYLEALDILTQGLSPDRRLALKKYLGDRADHFVFGYEEISERFGPGGVSLAVEVMVNRPALRDCLKNLGLLDGRTEPEPINLTAEVGESNRLDQIRSLLRLSNLEQSEEARTRLRLEYVPAGAEVLGPDNRTHAVEDSYWNGSLVTPKALWTAQSPDLLTLWPALLGRLFAAMSADMPDRMGSRLVVSGWYATDGVQEFDRLLGEWMNVIQERRLLEMTLRPQGIEAVWSVDILAPANFRAKLDSFASSRGLQFRIEQPEQAEQDGEDGQDPESGNETAKPKSAAGGASPRPSDHPAPAGPETGGGQQ